MIRVDEAGIAWQTCPACGQEVVPSANGWRRHTPYCPAVVPPQHELARWRAALRALLKEATSEQHRQDRQNRGCPPMEAAIERAELLLKQRGRR